MHSWTPSRRIRVGAVAIFLLATATCTPPGPISGGQPAGTASASTNLPPIVGWLSLFDGRTLNGWRVYGGQSQPGGWFVKDGALMKSQATDDIITSEQFSNFELQFDWKLSRGGNSGVFYRATEEYNKVYWSSVEFALLDDANARDGQSRLTSAGAAHSLYPSPAGIVKPAGEWNTAKIVVRGAHAEHWLNGKKLFEFEFGSPDWETRVKASKFAAWPNFGRARRGYIAFQGDHAGELALKNLKIRELR
jgi:hypothetical protein